MKDPNTETNQRESAGTNLTVGPLISQYPQKNADYVQSKWSTLNSLVPNSKYQNYISQANGANKVSLQLNLAWPNQSQTAESYAST